jgi:hypothetical protein
MDEYVGAVGEDPITEVGVQAVNQIRLGFAIRGYLDIESATGAVLPKEPAQSGPYDEEAWRRYYAISGVLSAEALEAAFKSQFPGLNVRVTARMGGPTAAGPVYEELLHLVLGDDPVARIGTYAELGLLVKSALAWLRDKKTQSLRVDSGVAMLLAAEVVFNETGTNDLALAGVTPVMPLEADYPGQYEGFLIAFRDDHYLYEVPVSVSGKTGPMTRRAIDFFDMGHEDESMG